MDGQFFTIDAAGNPTRPDLSNASDADYLKAKGINHTTFQSSERHFEGRLIMEVMREYQAAFQVASAYEECAKKRAQAQVKKPKSIVKTLKTTVEYLTPLKPEERMKETLKQPKGSRADMAPVRAITNICPEWKAEQQKQAEVEELKATIDILKAQVKARDERLAAAVKILTHA